MSPTGWSSISPRRTDKISRSAPAKLTVDGRYLYGAPASALDLEGEIVIGPAKERPGLAGYQFGLADEEVET